MKWADDSGCELKILHLEGTRIKFELLCNRGAPSHNSGVAYGIIGIKGNEATYKRQGASRACDIKFHFQEKTVVVSQNGSDAACGFGWGVYADGTYFLKGREQPEFVYQQAQQKGEPDCPTAVVLEK